MLLLLPNTHQQFQLLPVSKQPIIHRVKWRWICLWFVLWTVILGVKWHNQQKNFIIQQQALNSQLQDSMTQANQLKNAGQQKNVLGALTPTYLRQRLGFLPMLQALAANPLSDTWLNTLDLDISNQPSINVTGMSVELASPQAWVLSLKTMPAFNQFNLKLKTLTIQPGAVNSSGGTGSAQDSSSPFTNDPKKSGRVIIFYRAKYGDNESSTDSKTSSADQAYGLPHFNFAFGTDQPPQTKKKRS